MRKRTLSFACQDKCNKVRSEELCVGGSGKMESYGRGILRENPCRPIPVGFCEWKQENFLKLQMEKGQNIFFADSCGSGTKKTHSEQTSNWQSLF